MALVLRESQIRRLIKKALLEKDEPVTTPLKTTGRVESGEMGEFAKEIGIKSLSTLPDPYDTVVQQIAREGSKVILKTGSKGAAVTDLQALLNLASIIENEVTGYAGIPDGSFKSNTDKAVREFQKNHGLSVDGDIGPNTAKALMKIIVGGKRDHGEKGMKVAFFIVKRNSFADANKEVREAFKIAREKEIESHKAKEAEHFEIDVESEKPAEKESKPKTAKEKRKDLFAEYEHIVKTGPDGGALRQADVFRAKAVENKFTKDAATWYADNEDLVAELEEKGVIDSDSKARFVVMMSWIGDKKDPTKVARQLNRMDKEPDYAFDSDAIRKYIIRNGPQASRTVRPQAVKFAESRGKNGKPYPPDRASLMIGLQAAADKVNSSPPW